VKSILAAPQREVLEQLAWSNVLLGFDFDGTLAPIVDEPERAALRASTRRLLVELAELYPCVVISGRAVRDVQQRLEGIALRAVVGNHGSSPGARRTSCGGWSSAGRSSSRRPWPGSSASSSRTRSSRSPCTTAARARRRRAVAGIARALGRLGEVRVIGGKQVVNVLPLGAPHKGVALERERDRLGCDTAFFIGDDETDEDVFALDRPGRLLTVRVGTAPVSRRRRIRLPQQAQIDALLGRLIELRKDVARAPRRQAR
jgi:trehalose 6-phosphate phosphatase